MLNGDVTDCYEISDFSKNPMEKADLLLEQRLSGNLMDRLAKSSTVRYWLGGNHEDRLRRYIWKYAPALGVLPELSFPRLMQIADHGFEWRDYGKVIRVGKLRVVHGNKVLKHSGQTAKAHFEDFLVSVLVGHTHRLGKYYRKSLGEMHVAIENGCLCRLDPEYAQNPNWQHGFSVVQVDDKTGLFSVQQIPIMKYRNKTLCFYGKEKYVV